MKKNLLSLLLLATPLTLMGCGTTVVEDTNYITENVQITDSETALTRLKDGNKRFVNNNSALINVTSDRRDQLVDGQNPYAIVVSCSDSRVTPSLIFNAGLGEIFDIRIAGNVVDDDALGSIEYGVEHLHSPLIVVIGHEKCGAVTAAYDNVKNGTKAEGHIESIVEKIAPSIKSANSLDDAVHKNIDAVYNEISKDEIVKHALDSGNVKLVKAYYALDGTVTFEE